MTKIRVFKINGDDRRTKSEDKVDDEDRSEEEVKVKAPSKVLFSFFLPQDPASLGTNNSTSARGTRSNNHAADYAEKCGQTIISRPIMRPDRITRGA